ncbi:MAG: GNAT family N-acetyltransferase [Azospirillaceae bacterium]|nr:GNAT family N-acetyltransferase [Azospirillaceae bacterium]
MTQTNGPVEIAPDIHEVASEPEVAACYGLMRQLRPHLLSEPEFVERWRRQTGAGYCLLAIWNGPRPVALAGYRVQDNLMHGRHFYVDDLVTDEALRGSGLGHALMNRLKAEARALGCAKLLLDTPLSNRLGQRFYEREGLSATALRFSITLA